MQVYSTTMAPPKYKVGDILRYDNGHTALFRVEHVSEDHDGRGGHRYYGQTFYGSSLGAYEQDCQPATKFEKARWDARGTG